MAKFCVTFSAALFSVCLVSATDLFAQSSVITTDVKSGLRSAPVVQTEFAEWPSTLSPVIRRWEQILNQAPKTPFDQTKPLPVQRLLNWISKQGVPIRLDQSALDDSLNPKEPFILVGPGSPLIRRLDQSLKKYNSTLAVVDNQMIIISLDVAMDPEYFLTVSFDASSLDTGVYDLIDKTKALVDPSGWSDTSGDGILEAQFVDGRPILTISNSYRAVRQVRDYWQGLQSLAPTQMAQGQAYSRNGLAWSQVIEIPRNRVRQKGKQKIKGIGGFGGGGGVF